VFLLATVLIGIIHIPGTASGFQQEINSAIFGKILDRTTGEPLLAANVYLNNTTLGDATNENGEFAIYNIPIGTHELVATYMGYEPYRRSLKIRSAQPREITIRLKPRTLEHEEVVVSATDPKQWRKDLEKFYEKFFSTTKNAEECEIVNPEALSFASGGRRGFFKAAANDLLQVENRALGYRLNILLEEFTVEGTLIYIRAGQGFQELTPKDAEERIKWSANRLNAYKGSRRHFLNALTSGTLVEEGFEVYLVSGINDKEEGYFSEMVVPEDILSPGDLPAERHMSFDSYLKIIYLREKEPQEFVRYRLSNTPNFDRMPSTARRQLEKPTEQVSWIKLNFSPVTIDTLGNVRDPFAITNFGFWTWKRVADMVPMDYFPYRKPETKTPARPAVTKAIPLEEIADMDFGKLAFLNRETRKKLLYSDDDYISLTSGLESDRENTESLNRLGYVLIRYDRFDSARTVFRKSLVIKKDQPDAHTGLGLAFLKQGLKENLFITLIEKLTMTDNYSYAERELKKALDIDPDFHKAREYLAELYVVKGGMSNLNQAKERLEEIIAADPAYPRVYFKLGVVEYEREDYNAAESALRKQLDLLPDDPPSQVYLGRTIFKLGRTAESNDIYLAGLSRLEDYDTLEDIYRYVFPQMTAEEKQAYESSPYNRRGAFIAQFWKMRDADIMTPVNERLTEHMRRVDYVRQKYRVKNPRGYDDRGLVYLRFGEPDEKYVDVVTGNARDNESWLYSRFHENALFDFVVEGGVYLLAPDLRSALLRGSNSPAQDLEVIYQRRSHLSNVYARIADRLSNISGGSITQLNTEISRTLNQYIPDVQLATNSAPVEHFKPEYDIEPFQFPLSAVQFRTDKGKTAVEIQYGIPYNELPYVKREDKMLSEVITNIVVLDTLGGRLDELHRRNTYELEESDDPYRLFSLGRELLELPAGSYRIGLEVKPVLSQKKGQYQFTLPVRDFGDSGLLLSDILVCWPEDIHMIQPGKKRAELPVRPYPFVNVRRDNPLVIYYEIYNLRPGVGGSTTYTIEYSVRQADSSKGIIGRLFSGRGAEVTMQEDRVAGSVDEIETISLDISKLPPGEAVITVRITDRTSGKTATVTRPITIMQQ